MKYINPTTEKEEDTNTVPVWRLLALVRLLSRGMADSRIFIGFNGNITKELVRAIRARFFREDRPISGILRHQLNMIDPPLCRCGKPGTRIIGGTTFCTRCGPTSDKQHSMVWRHQFSEEKSRDIIQHRKEKDTKDLGELANHKNKTARKNRK